MRQIIIKVDGNDIGVQRPSDMTDAEFSGVLGAILHDHTVKKNIESAWPWVSNMIEKEVERQTAAKEATHG